MCLLSVLVAVALSERDARAGGQRSAFDRQRQVFTASGRPGCALDGPVCACVHGVLHGRAYGARGRGRGREYGRGRARGRRGRALPRAADVLDRVERLERREQPHLPELRRRIQRGAAQARHEAPEGVRAEAAHCG